MMRAMILFVLYLTMQAVAGVRVKRRSRLQSNASQKSDGVPVESVVMNIKQVTGDPGDSKSSWMDLFMKAMPIDKRILDPFTPVGSGALATPADNWSPEGSTTIAGDMAFQFGIPKSPCKKDGSECKNFHYRFWHKYDMDITRNGQIGGFVYYSGRFDKAMAKKNLAANLLILAQDGSNQTHMAPDTILGANILTFGSKFDQDSSVAAQMLRVPAGDWRFVPSARKWPRPSIETRIQENLQREGALKAWLSPKQLPPGGLADVFGMPIVNYLWLPGGMSGNFVRDKADAARCNAYGAFLVTFDGSHKSWLYCMAWRKVMDEPVYPCNGLMSAQTMSFIADEYMQKSGAISAFYSTAPTTSSMMLLLGGSGAGKSSLISRLSTCSNARVDKWVLSGLDEFLDWIPEYVESVKDPYVGYTKAADKCYWPEAIGIAKQVNSKATAKHLPIIVEDTGKDLKRTIEFVENLGRGRKVTIAMVDNDPENAVSRALGRFQMTGRWSPAEYIRESFAPVWDTFKELEKMHSAGKFPVATMSFIYCDNSRNFDSRCWLKSGDDQVWPRKCFEKGKMEKLQNKPDQYLS